jgi:1,4-alpha-glucan branching enzyme
VFDAVHDGSGDAVATFRLPTLSGAATACVVGEFNNWSATATPMTRDGEWFVATVLLRVGKSYRFRYLLDGERWENDWAADAYVPNEFGGEDSLIDLTGIMASTDQTHSPGANGDSGVQLDAGNEPAAVRKRPRMRVDG